MGTRTVGEVRHAGQRLAYELHEPVDAGVADPPVLVFTHGLLFDAALNRTMAALLAARGHRVVLPELLGHGRSDKPLHASEHRLELYTDQILSLLDHLELDQAVVGGVSLGANVSLQVALVAPSRVRAMVLEMPVLERGTVAAAANFLPLLVALRYLPGVLRPVSRLLRRLPRTGVHSFDAVLNLASADPREAAAVIHGLFAGPVAPVLADRRRLDVPALVIGHGYDLLHPMDDAAALAEELPDAQLLEARSILEARTFPARIVGEIATFLDATRQPRTAASRGA